jgi:glyoxylase-like metal-dependent hydrolase (beta-lactamase superfamily II)
MLKTIEKIGNIYKFTLPTPFAVGPVNVYLIKSDVLTLVDAGPKTAEAWNTLQLYLKELGYTPNDIEQVILTHHHPDHVGLLDYLPKSIRIIGHWRNDPWLKKEPAFVENVNHYFQNFYTHLGLPQQGEFNYFSNSQIYSCTSALTEQVKEGDGIAGLPGWTVIETPGHAQSHIALLHENDGMLLGGDHVIDHISSNPILEPPYSDKEDRPRPQIDYNQSLQKCLELDISVILAGHGKNVENKDKLIKDRLSQQKKRAHRVLAMLEQSPTNVYDICKKLFPKAYKNELSLTLSETIAQLDYLEYEGLIDVDQSEDVWTYYPMKGKGMKYE